MKTKGQINNGNIFHNRQERLYQKLSELELDGLLISSQTNIAYVTGFPSRESYLLFSKKGNFFITDFRFLEESKQNLKDFNIEQIRGSVFKLIKELAVKLKLNGLGFEANH
jgi:Xaa-Pro aminopeptidase